MGACPGIPGTVRVVSPTPLPPGTILLLRYLRERLETRPPSRFIEVGIGHGALAAMLLQMGWSGAGYDLNADALTAARTRNTKAIDARRLSLHHGDWLESDAGEPVDLIVSAMLLEHLADGQVTEFFDHARASLRPQGLLIVMVPGSPRHWGVEDEIAGHVRRYDRETLRDTVEAAGWTLTHLAGLAYPLANLTLPLSNFMVKRAETDSLRLTPKQRTIRSGDRGVRWKTTFPSVAQLVLNERTLYPFHLLQKANLGHRDCLLLYAECELGEPR